MATKKRCAATTQRGSRCTGRGHYRYHGKIYCYSHAMSIANDYACKRQDDVCVDEDVDSARDVLEGVSCWDDVLRLREILAAHDAECARFGAIEKTWSWGIVDPPSSLPTDVVELVDAAYPRGAVLDAHVKRREQLEAQFKAALRGYRAGLISEEL